MSTEPLESSQVKSSLLTSFTTLGVDDWLFILNLCVAILVSVILRFYSWPLIAVGLHFGLMIVTKLSPNILETYVKHSRQATRYSPFSNVTQKRNLRPSGFGREPL